ncbi:phosphatase PAP2 family protein [Cytobacillus purgationiresistens]|uniref:Undecaprenyl-diphosphatase n=1 Tax=Cytobacillus purgationiresistens TaxID=863449 RepID=A0ABU0AGU3_9BACI|nr:phosphatase PAP2 family protein [Cytobacillus purgationiresistens]MDQ0270476.1 undecaprenyl-diphosphatase [Cytobacillus purgationiresistens]
MKKSTVYYSACIGIIGLSILLFMLIVRDFSRNDLAWFDWEVISFIQSYISSRMTGIVNVITFFGSVKWFVFAVLFLLILLVMAKKYALAVFVVFSSGAGGLFNWFLKWIFQRDRPVFQPLIEVTGFSFPSGHSMGSFVFYGSLAFVLIHFVKKIAWRILICTLLFLVIATIGVSRIYLGVHYPSDVLAGFLSGAVWLMVNIIAFQAYENRVKKLERID